MQKHIYDLRYEVDKTEWRIRAKRHIVYQLWEQFRSGKQSSEISDKAYLDLGCGTGVLQEEFEKKYPGTTAHGIDVMKEAIEYCKKRGLERANLYDGKKIPFKDNTFDLLTAIDVLEHIEDDKYSMNEIKRVLKKGGLGIFIVPAHMELWSTRDIRLQHYRRYEFGELEKKCKDAGFKVMTSKNADFLLYFVLLLMAKNAKKNKDGVAELGMETAQAPWLVNEAAYIYECFENFWLRIADFPIGISKVVVVKK